MPALLYPGGKGALLTKRHDHIGHCCSIDGRLTKVEEWQNVRMVEHGDSPGFALKKACRIGIESICLEYLDRYLPSQLIIFCKVHFAHAPTSEQTEKAEAAQA
jgi:hypothetical protein